MTKLLKQIPLYVLILTSLLFLFGGRVFAVLDLDDGSSPHPPAATATTAPATTTTTAPDTAPDTSGGGGRSLLGSTDDIGLPDNSAESVVKIVMNSIFIILGTIAVVMILVGGMRFVIGRGDPGQIKQARDTILYGAIGLVIVILATTIVGLVIGTTDKVLK